MRGAVRATALLFALLAVLAPPRRAAYAWQLPRGFPNPRCPPTIPMSAAKVALGAKLFADPRLRDGRIFLPELPRAARALHRRMPRSRGATGATAALNAPTLLNAAYNPSLAGTTRVTHLRAADAWAAVQRAPAELGLAGRERVVEQRWRLTRRCARIRRALSGERRRDHGQRRSAPSPPTNARCSRRSAFDRYVFAASMPRSTPRRSAACSCSSPPRRLRACHGGINFAGPGWTRRTRPGWFRRHRDRRAVRVPTLRNLARTAPYMHDGRFATLDAVLDHYERLAVDPAADPRCGARH
jgi:cytochrome c peroxidase